MKLKKENKERAISVVQMLRKARYTGPWQPYVDEALVRLLADVRHLCDGQDKDYAELDRKAYVQYIRDKGL